MSELQRLYSGGLRFIDMLSGRANIASRLGENVYCSRSEDAFLSLEVRCDALVKTPLEDESADFLEAIYVQRLEAHDDYREELPWGKRTSHDLSMAPLVVKRMRVHREGDSDAPSEGGGAGHGPDLMSDSDDEVYDWTAVKLKVASLSVELGAASQSNCTERFFVMPYFTLGPKRGI